MSLHDDTAAMARALYGQHAVHVPTWMWVQHTISDTVGYVGASRDINPHPLRFGSTRTHQFVLGEVIVRPHLVIATDALRGHGLDGLIYNDQPLDRLLDQGEVVLGDEAHARRMFRW